MEIQRAVVGLSALAQESRLRAFRLLVQAGPAGLPAGVIAEQLDIPPATLSFHLKELNHAHLIEASRHGRTISYAIRVTGIHDLMSFLTEDCCQGRPELCTPPCCEPTKRASRRKR